MYLRSIWHSLLAKAQKNGPYTAFDAMKLFALLNMTLDHLGAYFFPDQVWLRMLGRITFPVWFFLVGYSRTRTLGKDIWIYAALLVVNHIVVGRGILPFNALVSVILCRIMLNAFLEHRLFPGKIPEIMVFFVILSFITIPLFEYGSIAFMFALFGWMVRENQKEHFTGVMVTSYLSFTGWQLISFNFNIIESFYVILGTAWVIKWLAEPQFKVIWTEWGNSYYKTCITVLSRNTLLYYFLHRLVFEIISTAIYHKNTWLTVKIF